VPRVCTVCTHPERRAIDLALAVGTAKRELSALFRVSEDAITRHAATHLPATVVKAQEVEDVRQALDVVQQLKAINAASREILTAARKSGDGELALKAIDRIFKQIELQAKLLGELEQEGTVSILLAPEWVQVRALVLTALAPYPEARGAVAANLAKLEAVGG
jgi:hypothetical protein